MSWDNNKTALLGLLRHLTHQFTKITEDDASGYFFCRDLKKKPQRLDLRCNYSTSLKPKLHIIQFVIFWDMYVSTFFLEEEVAAPAAAADDNDD